MNTSCQCGPVGEGNEMEKAFETSQLFEVQLAELNRRIEDVEQIFNHERFLEYLVKYPVNFLPIFSSVTTDVFYLGIFIRIERFKVELLEYLDTLSIWAKSYKDFCRHNFTLCSILSTLIGCSNFSTNQNA